MYFEASRRILSTSKHVSNFHIAFSTMLFESAKNSHFIGLEFVESELFETR
jgi:hypothetical protein